MMGKTGSAAFCIAVIVLLMLSAQAFAQTSGGDNLYCKPGNVAAFGTSDGPAALPQSCFYTALQGTPSPGKQIEVRAGGDLQKAIAQAKCGDTLVLAAGAEYVGGFEFPNKSCDEAHWITVRSDGAIPPEGTRITPCYAGIDALPGRPRYSCASPVKAMARLTVPTRDSITVTNHYRFIGLEITRPPGGPAHALMHTVAGDKIILDRVWMHGTATDETQRGLAFPGATRIAVIDSYLSDLHCIARTGSCTDSQTVWAGAGPDAGGTYKIVNNYLESSGEGILFGGAAASATPADIEIRRNHFFKPLSWNPKDPSYLGVNFISKNNLEFKNASRVLVEGNVFENSWGGYSQAGYQLLLTPKNQDNRCPSCVVRDITIRYSVMRHSGAGIQLVSAKSGAGGLSQGLMNVSIHDVIITDIDAARFAGNGFVFLISNDGPPYHDIAIDHVTVPSGGRDLMVVGSRMGDPMRNISITNSVLDVGQFQVTSTGGHQNCAYNRVTPQAIFDACWAPYTFVNNVLIGPRGVWPEGNFSAKNAEAAGFMSSKGEREEDLQLSPRNRFRNKAKDLKDPGADIARVMSAIAGVE